MTLFVGDDLLGDPLPVFFLFPNGVAIDNSLGLSHTLQDF